MDIVGFAFALDLRAFGYFCLLICKYIQPVFYGAIAPIRLFIIK